MDAKFSPQVKDILTFSNEEAARLGNNYIGLEHLFLGIVRQGESKTIRILQILDVDIESFRKNIENAIRNPDPLNAVVANIPLMKQTERALKFTFLAAKELNSDIIHTEHLMIAILRDRNNLVTRKLNGMGVNLSAFKDELKFFTGSTESHSSQPRAEFSNDPSGEEDEIRQGGSSAKKSGDSKSKTPVLDTFGRDLTRAAEENRLDPIVGREKELERVAQILSRRKKTIPSSSENPVLGSRP